MRPDTSSIRRAVKVLACSAVLATVTALAGCGGGSEKPAALGSAAAAATGTSSSTASSSAASSSGAATSSAPSTSASVSGTGDYAAFPGFTPPADLKTTFDPIPSTGDPVKDKILADDIQVQRAFEVWDVTGNFNFPGVSTYLGTGIYGEYQQQAAQYHAAGKVPGGVTRYYSRKVVALDGRAARVIDCEDGRKNYDKIAKTGQVVPDSSDGIVDVTTTYVKNAAGVYQAQMSEKQKNPALCTAP